jgi:hypothetical protein
VTAVASAQIDGGDGLIDSQGKEPRSSRASVSFRLGLPADPLAEEDSLPTFDEVRLFDSGKLHVASGWNKGLERLSRSR